MLKKGLIIFQSLIMLFVLVNEVKAQISDETFWKIRFKFSYENTSGNTDTKTLSGNLESEKVAGADRYYIKGKVLYGSEANEEIKNKWSLGVRWERLFSNRIFGFLSSEYLRDRFSGYDYRVLIGPGLGYDIVKTNKHYLKGLFSSLYSYDDYDITSKEGRKSDSYVSGKASIEYSWEIFEYLKLRQIADYSLSFKYADKYFIDSETSLEVKINEYLAFGISYIINYQNQLPLYSNEHTDLAFTSSLILEF